MMAAQLVTLPSCQLSSCLRVGCANKCPAALLQGCEQPSQLSSCFPFVQHGGITMMNYDTPWATAALNATCKYMS